MILDTNIVIDLIETSAPTHIAAAVADISDGQDLYVNEIIFAELSGRSTNAPELVDLLQGVGIKVSKLSLEACHRAGVAFNAYRKAGTARTTILPDFLIGAHAATQGWPLVTRDRKIFSTYFPELELINPLQAGND